MNQLTLQFKRLGKKKIKQLQITLDSKPETLKELIEACVRHEVRRYNEKHEGVTILPFLSPAEIQDQGETGKIVFGDTVNKTLAHEETAIENALLAHKDGLYLVFINDDEVNDLEAPLKLTEESIVSFLRMTFLSGAHW